MIIIPTCTLAGDVFGTSYQAIVEARGVLGNQPAAAFPLGLLARGWLDCSEAERVTFVTYFEAEIWHALERVTDFHR